MSVIKVTDIAFVRLRSPDLASAERFLTDFGLTVQHRAPTALYMRGTGRCGFVHVTELGDPKVLAVAFTAPSEDALATLATVEGASNVEDLDGTRGGKRVRLRDPHGMQVEIVHGIDPLEPLPVYPTVMNVGTNKPRQGALCRPPHGPAQVQRLGHIVFKSPDVLATHAWYRETFGLLCSDDVYAGEPDNIIGSFNRCDRGDEYVDHHTLFVVEGTHYGMNHVAYEVEGIDDIMLGHAHLAGAGYKHVWGIGRHYLGSQIFDYWQDPWGRVHEHWTDGDKLNATTAGNLLPAEIGLASQWGENTPPEFAETAS
jgi:catechol 2,3-dioxygenase-like lactoylglutathione lyase family enzyme